MRIRWRDFEVLTCGPWCQGPVLAQALRHARGGRRRWPRPQRRRPRAPGHRGAEGGVRRPRVPLRRPGVRRRRPRRAAVRRARPTPGSAAIDMRARRARRCRRRSAGRSTSACCRRVTEAMLPARGRARHVLRLRDRPLGQRLLGDAVRRRRSARRSIPGLGIVPSARGDAVAARPAPPVRRRPGQAPAPDPEPGDRRARRRLGVHVRLPGRRHAGAGDAAGVPQRRSTSGWTCRRRSTRRASRPGASPNSFAPFEYLPGLFGYEDRFPTTRVIDDLERAATDGALAGVHALGGGGGGDLPGRGERLPAGRSRPSPAGLRDRRLTLVPLVIAGFARSLEG